MHVRFSNRAEADLKEIKEYLEPRSPQGLDRVMSAIFTTSGQLESFPFLGRSGRVPDTFEITVPRTPFFLVYAMDQDEAYYIDILRVMHTSRSYPIET